MAIAMGIAALAKSISSKREMDQRDLSLPSRAIYSLQQLIAIAQL
jgi:hypothetical protein